MVSVRYLLDTDALSEPIRSKPNAAFLSKFRAHHDEIAIAAVTWHEALFGLHRLDAGKRKRLILEYLTTVIAPSIPVLGYDARAAEWHAQERARLERRGQPTPFADGQIASIAKVNDLVIVTANVRHFAPFSGIVTDNWMTR